MHEGHPKRPIGKCPNNLNKEVVHQLLQEAIPDASEDSDIERLYVVHNGAVYEARSSNGQDWHGYPYNKKISRRTFERLREQANQKQCVESFESWTKKYRMVTGK